MLRCERITKHKEQQCYCILIHNTHTTQEESAESSKSNFTDAIFFFLRYKGSYDSYPCGFYVDHVFQVVCCEAFIRSEVFTFYPGGFYSGCGFTKITHDVFIPPMCTIWHHRV